MRMHATEGEIDDVRRAMPDALKPLWDDEF